MRKEFEMRNHLWWVSLLVFAIACASCSGKKDEPENAVGFPTADVVAADTRSPDERREQIADRVDKLVAEAAKLPRTEFDPAALAVSLGHDPQKHFEWVRDHTSWAPYRGLLRGSQGVMLDRVGSNLDRSVLLGDLLRRSGHTVRLAHATLSEGQARELLGKVRPMPAQRAASATGELSVKSQQAKSKAESLVELQTQTIIAALKDAANAKQDDDSVAIAALRDHWWVERQENGKWISLDVLLPDAKAGETLADSSSTSVWNAADAAPSIPDSEWHTVDLRVVVERYEAGATTEATVLKTTLRPAETLGKPLRLSHAPVPWPDALPDPDVDPQPFRDAALAVKLWIPVLQVGSEKIVNAGYTEKGDLQSELVESVNDIGKVGGAGVASGMDMALGGFSPDEVTPAATAEWIDYEIKVPGAETQRLRRPIFDLLGPARRASHAADFDGTPDLRKLERFEALWAPTDILLQTSDFTGDFFADLHSADVVANQKALKDLASEKDPAKARELATELLGRIEIWGSLPNYALWRSNLGANAGDSFIDRPNVFHYRAGRAVVKAGRGVFRELIDVASNPGGTRSSSHNKSFEIRVRQGVADTVAEMLALGADAGTAENTASVFSRLPADNNRGLL
ncbi:MAG: hypothetical protein WBO00_01190, partial [Steroidobacteraceae bacterium]